MRREVLSFVALFALLITTVACSSPKSLKITEANKDSVLEDIKSESGFTVEEVQLLAARQLRVKMAAATGQTGPAWVGQTLQQIIDDERRLRDDEKAKQLEADRLAAEAKAKEAALAEELRQTLALSVFDKAFRASNPYAGEYEDFIILKCAYENKSAKGVRAFRGSVRFADLFDKEIAEVNLTVDDPIAAGSKDTWTGTIKYNQFVDWHKALRNADLANMKITWVPKSIIFDDGTQIGEK